jgi:site-specific DNA recombinase
LGKSGLSGKLKAVSSVAGVDPRKVAIYIRWSTEDQGDGTTLEVQRRNCEMYVQSQSWDINPDLVYIDEGCSGGNMERPALNRMREAVARGEIDCVVVYKLDRLSRSVLDTVNLVLDEWDDRCHVKSATQPLDTRDPLGKQFFYMLVGFAEYERQIIKERTFSGKLSRANEGKNAGQFPPYGFKKGPAPGSFQVVPEEMEIVQRIIEESLGGNGAATVCKRLNADGIPYHDHRKAKATTWKEVTIKYMLRNPLYTGRLVYGQSRVQNRPKPGEPLRIHPEEPLVDVQAILFGADGELLKEPPISVEDFEENHRRMAARAKKPTSNRTWVSEHLLTGLVRCPACDMAMHGRKKQLLPTGGIYTGSYYVCHGGKRRGMCDNAYIRQDGLDGLVVDLLRKRYGDAIARQQLLMSVAAETSKKVRQMEVAMEEVRKELADSNRRLSDLREEYVQRKLTLEEYRDFKGHVDRECEEVRQREGRLLKQLAELQEAQKAEGDMEHLALRLDSWESLTIEQKKMLMSEFVVKVTAFRAKGSDDTDVEIYWRQGAREVKEALSVS